ncbi:MAG: DNA repair protein RecN [Flavobacteriales bacterium]
MLRELTIRNYALIDACDVEFEDGLSLVTGETGSGKSIVIGALSLVLGSRADASALFDKERKCIVEASFEIQGQGLEAFFEEADLDLEPYTTLRREIQPKGRSRAFINDTPVKLETMKALGDRLVDVHGQDETRLLKDKSFITRFLDAFAGQEKDLDQYRYRFEAYRAKVREWEALKERLKRDRSDEDYYRFQLNELDEIDLDPERYREEEEELKRLEHAERIRGSLHRARDILQQDTYGVLDRLRELRDEWEGSAEVHSGIRELQQRLQSSYIELDDIASEVDRMSDMEEEDPERMRALREKQDRIRDLMQKHDQQEVEALRSFREELRERLRGTGDLEQQEKELRETLETEKERLEAWGRALDEGRQGVLEQVSNRAQAYLVALGMGSSRIEAKLEEEEGLTSLGKSSVSLAFRSTPGARPQELSKVASGGERSRIMLAMKAVFSEVRSMPSMILDEIDTGVSGDIAEKVGTIMKGMAERSQLIAITHLPQIAGKGDQHYQVMKEEEDGELRTRVRKLAQEERVQEVARMLSGEETTQAAIDQAKELLGT